MRTLSLMEQGLVVRASGDLLLVERAGRTIQEVRLIDIDEVLVFGNVQLTTSAIASLLRRRVDTVFLTQRGWYRGRLVGPMGRQIDLRVAQFERFREAGFALTVARTMVAGKLANQRQLLLRAQRERRLEELAGPIAQLRVLAERAREAADMDALRGIEGRGAAVYFGQLGRCLTNPAFSFTRRTRRPPRDPVNAVLSFGYTLLGIQMESAVLRAGFDPALGAFHGVAYGRPSLVLDLIEEWRPVLVDALMLRLVNRRELSPEDFERIESGFDDEEEGPAAEDDAAAGDGPGIWLADTGRRIVFRAWGRRLRDVVLVPHLEQRLMFEEVLRQQVYLLARVVKGEADGYVPFQWR